MEFFGARLLEPMASSLARCGLSGIAHFNVCSFWQRMLKCLFSAGKEIFHAIVFNMLQQELIPHLFRTEFRKIAAVLCKTLVWSISKRRRILPVLLSWPRLKHGPIKAFRKIRSHGCIQWAKNKAKNHLNRDKLFAAKIAKDMALGAAVTEVTEIDLSEQNINDSQLQMLFAVCHPSIPAEAQVGLALRILCGFGIEEIAVAFLTNKETINKRLYRAKEKLRQEKLLLSFRAKALSVNDCRQYLQRFIFFSVKVIILKAMIWCCVKNFAGSHAAHIIIVAKRSDQPARRKRIICPHVFSCLTVYGAEE